MHIVFRQIGGFAGLTVKVELDEAQLSPEARAEARHLLSEHDSALEPSGPRPPTGEGADLLVYEITIIERRRHVTLHFDALSVPPEADVLVDELREAATGEGPPSASHPPRRPKR